MPALFFKTGRKYRRKGYLLRWLATVSSTFQQSYFVSGSVRKLFINLCYNLYQTNAQSLVNSCGHLHVMIGCHGNHKVG